MNDLNQHYRDLLGLDDSWNVDEVDLDLTGTQVVIHLSFVRVGAELPRVRRGVSPSRHGPAANLAASRHDAVFDGDPGCGAPLPLREVWGQDDPCSLGRQALAVHA